MSTRPRGSQRLVLRASAKVNLALEVLGKRGDGYHEIATVLQAVDLFDRLTVDPDETLSLHTDDPELPTDDGNLVTIYAYDPASRGSNFVSNQTGNRPDGRTDY